jgi:hypothetical protein
MIQAPLKTKPISYWFSLVYLNGLHPLVFTIVMYLGNRQHNKWFSILAKQYKFLSFSIVCISLHVSTLESRHRVLSFTRTEFQKLVSKTICSVVGFPDTLSSSLLKQQNTNFIKTSKMYILFLYV